MKCSRVLGFSEPAEYFISVQGKIPQTIFENFVGIKSISVTENDPNYISSIKIKIKDQAHLSGIINAFYEWRFPILKIECEGTH